MIIQQVSEYFSFMAYYNTLSCQAIFLIQIRKLNDIGPHKIGSFLNMTFV